MNERKVPKAPKSITFFKIHFPALLHLNRRFVQEHPFQNTTKHFGTSHFIVFKMIIFLRYSVIFKEKVLISAFGQSVPNLTFLRVFTRASVYRHTHTYTFLVITISKHVPAQHMCLCSSSVE